MIKGMNEQNQRTANKKCFKIPTAMNVPILTASYTCIS